MPNGATVQEVQGVPSGLAEENITAVQGVPEGLKEEALPKPQMQVQGVPEGLTEESLHPVAKPVAQRSPSAPAVAKSTTKPPYAGVTAPAAKPVTPQGDLLTELDKNNAALPPAGQLAVKAARGVRGLYHGVMGDEESETSKGPTSTASPVAENLGFTPEHIGHEAGKMGRGLVQFGTEAVKDIASTKTPVVVPDTVEGKPNASFWDRVKNVADPEAHTLLAKYVTAPAQGEKDASEREMEEYFKTHGAAATGHAISAFLHGTLGEYVPAIGPLAMSITDQAQKGDIGGALTQLAALYGIDKASGKVGKGIKDRVGAKVEELTKPPEVKQAEANVESTKKPLADAQSKYDAAAAEHAKYTASHAQGIDSPKAVRSALDKAQAELDEAQAHHDIAKEHLEKTKAAQPTIPQKVGGAVGRTIGKVLPKETPAAEVPAENIEAAPVAKAEPESSPLTPLGNRPPTVSPAHTTTVIPQEPTAAPRPSYGRIQLANEQGTMGTPKMLTEGTPEGPQVPKGGLPKINLPEEKPVETKPAVGTAADLKSLKAKEGKVVDTEDTIEGRVHKLLQEALKPEEPKAEAEYKGEERRETPRPALMSPTEIEQAMKSRKPVSTPFDVTEGAMDTIKRDQAMPKHPAEEAAQPKEEPTGYTPKKEEIVPTGTEGREPAKSAAEYSPAVEQKVTELSDENLKKLAKAHGLNPDEYDFNARDERRHRTERDQLAKDVAEQMGEDEKINIGRAAERAENEPGFENRDRSSKANAERASKLFPRLRGPVDEFGNAAVAGGAPEKVDLKKTVGDYNKKEGLGEVKDNKVETSPRGKEIATAYDEMKHDPNDPEVKKSYNALISDVKKQWNSLEKAGITFEPTDKDPYTSYDEMKKDLEDNKRLKVFRGGNELPEDHPLAKVDPKTGETYNVMFRAVHDAIGHLMHDNDFSEKGEENAWDTHRQTMSPEAVPAMTTETRGQTSWFFNNGDTPGTFADQKAGILPDYANEPTPDSKAALDHIKSGKDFAVLTAENPDNTRLSPEENIKRNQKLVADLKAKGYEVIPIEGNTKDVEGQKEHSYFVKDISPEEAADLGRKHGQAAVLTTEGLHDLKTDTVNPSDNSKVLTGEEARKQPYYSKVGDTDFSVPIDFDRAAEPGKEPLPTVSGGSQSATKKIPTGDQLIKKYGESSGDPKDVTFILNDGRAVANTGVEHDRMLGGTPTDKNPPREKFIADGNIRVRPRMSAGGREVALSIPESGVNQKQLKYLTKMAPQLASGAVMIEIGKTGGDYRVIPYGEASASTLEKSIRDIAPILNDKGSPIDEHGNPTVSGGSQSAGTAKAKSELKLPELAEKHLTPEERASISKSKVGMKNFIDNFEKVPPLQEWVDAAKGGEGARHWYQRSGKAFDTLQELAPNYFKDGDREKFANFVAALSPRQMVHNNLREALHAWTDWVDNGRPTGEAMEKSLRDSISSAPDTKVPNAMLALNGEEMWPDLSKNRNFKVPSFGKNLNGYLNYSTNDGWQALFGGLDEKTVSNPSSYHPLSVMTRAAGEALGWTAAEAQAAIWSFTQALKEQGRSDPEFAKEYSEDFADIMAHNPEVRDKLKSLGVDLGKLDEKLRAIGEKPPITAGTSPTAEHSTRQLATRIEKARGEGSVPQPKSIQGNLFRESPAFEHRNKPRSEPRDEAASFNPEEFGNEESGLEKLGEKKKKSPLGKIR